MVKRLCAYYQITHFVCTLLTLRVYHHIILSFSMRTKLYFANGHCLSLRSSRRIKQYTLIILLSRKQKKYLILIASIQKCHSKITNWHFSQNWTVSHCFCKGTLYKSLIIFWSAELEFPQIIKYD